MDKGGKMTAILTPGPIDARFDAQTTAIREQFENTNVPLTVLTVMVQSQGQDIKELKERIERLDWRLDRVDQRMESGFEAINKRFGTLEGRISGASAYAFS
jgi:chromosome segregation ATPase